MNTHQQPSSKEWEKRVVELQFKTMLSRDMPEVAKKYHQEMIDFIQSLLTSHSEAIRERVIKKRQYPCQHGPSDSCDTECMYQDTEEKMFIRLGYNQALSDVDDILALLTDEKNI